MLINLPKLKTHGISTLTVGVKNLFGLVPGTVKVGYHAKLRDSRNVLPRAWWILPLSRAPP